MPNNFELPVAFSVISQRMEVLTLSCLAMVSCGWDTSTIGRILLKEPHGGSFRKP